MELVGDKQPYTLHQIKWHTSSQAGYIESIIDEGFYEKVVLIGFPYDLGAKHFS